MSFLGGLFSDKKETKSTSTQTGDQSYGLTPEVMEYWKKVSGMYGPDAWKNVDPNQYQTAAAQAGAGYASGLNPAVAGAMGIGATGIDPNAIARYQSPYTQQVIDATQRDFDTQNARQNASVNANAAKLGALSGTQPIVARNLAQESQRRQQDPIIANLRNQGFNTAAGLAGQDVSARLAGLGAAGSLIGQQAGITDRLFGQGTQLYNQAFQNAVMPYQINQQGASTLGGLIQGSGQHTSGTATGTQTQTATPSLFSIGSTIAGLGLQAFSDERLKENIKEVGATFDGQPIYKYNFKGSPKTEIGLIAQDVEKRNPSAVGSISGLKTVDYDAATKDAERERKAAGGSVAANDPHSRLASAFEAVHGMLHKARGGSVLPRPAFAEGGDVGLTAGGSAFDMGKLGKGLANLGQKGQGQGQGDDGGLLRSQQDGLSRMLSGMSAGRPGFAAGGFAGEWGDNGPVFGAPGSSSGIDAPMFAGVSRSELPPARDPILPPLNPSRGVNLIDEIKGFEGFRPKAYGDYKQHSVGYGTRATSPTEVITREDADKRLADEVAIARRHVDAFAPNLDPGTRDALTSLTFNAGTDWQKAGLGEAIKAGNWDEARRRFVQYTKAGGQELPGLVERRNKEASWIGSGGGTPTSIEPPRYLSPTTPEGVIRSLENVAGYHDGLGGSTKANPSVAFSHGQQVGRNPAPGTSAEGVFKNFTPSPSTPPDWGASEPSKDALWPWERPSADRPPATSVASGASAAPQSRAVTTAPAEKSWLQRILPGLSEGVFAGKEMTPAQRLGTMLMSVKSPTMNAPGEGMANAILQMDSARREQARIDQHAAQMIGELNGRPTVEAQRIALEAAKNPALIRHLDATSKKAELDADKDYQLEYLRRKAEADKEIGRADLEKRYELLKKIESQQQDAAPPDGTNKRLELYPIPETPSNTPPQATPPTAPPPTRVDPPSGPPAYSPPEDSPAGKAAARRIESGTRMQQLSRDRANEQKRVQAQFDADIIGMTPMEFVRKYGNARQNLSAAQIERIDRIIDALARSAPNAN